MCVVQIAPPGFPIPPKGLLNAGCEVVLSAPAGSKTSARLIETVSRPIGLNMTEVQKSRYFAETSREAYRQALALDADSVHDHTDFLPRKGFPLPIVRTIHGPAMVARYRRMSCHGDRLWRNQPSPARALRDGGQGQVRSRRADRLRRRRA